MTPTLQTAMAQAMSRLRTADVAGATEAIRDAMRWHARAGRTSTATPDPASSARTRSGLDEVLKTLKAGRAAFAHPATAPTVAAEDTRLASRVHRSPAGPLAYKLHVPEKAAPHSALLLMLHGCTQNPDDFACGTRMNRLADEFGVIVAYPHQPKAANAQGCWNWFDPRHQGAGSGEPAMLASLAGTLAAEFEIAADRIFVAGLSAGAAMAEVLAETHPEVFAAAGIHSGLPYRSAKDVVSAFAAMKGNGHGHYAGPKGSITRRFIVQGTADPTVHRSNADKLFETMRTRHPDATIVVSEADAGGRPATRQSLIAPSGASLAEYLLIEGAGHAWSGGDPKGSYTDRGGPDASRQMIEFFLG